MAKFTETIRERTKIVWTKVRPYGSYLVSLLLLVIIAGTTYSLVHKKKDTNQPTVNQEGLNPRIGDAIPPDVNPQAQPNNNSNSTAPAPSNTAYVAPHTGVDNNEPVRYWSDQWKFAATLPAHTKVTETSDGVNFGNYYSVTVAKSGNENLQSIADQLRNSPYVKSITITQTQINFTTASQKGVVIIQNGMIYYLLGNQYLETFHTI